MANKSTGSFLETLRAKSNIWVSKPQRFSVNYSGLSDIGMSRSENQDCLGVFPKENNSYCDDKGQLFLIADGMGGHARGGEASKLAVYYVPEIYFSDETEDVHSSLFRAFENANARILERWEEAGSADRMGTTCSALVLLRESVFVAHVGDSRIYRIRKNKIEQLTDDHTYVAELQRRGLFTEEEAKNNPRRSELLRAMGVNQELEVDIFETSPLRLGDVYVLCTDGLVNVPKEEILEIVKNHQPEDACRELVDLENSRGGDDNITVQVVSIEAAVREQISLASFLSDYRFRYALGYALILLIIGSIGFFAYQYRYNISQRLLSLFFTEPIQREALVVEKDGAGSGDLTASEEALEKWLIEARNYLKSTADDTAAINAGQSSFPGGSSRLPAVPNRQRKSIPNGSTLPAIKPDFSRRKNLQPAPSSTADLNVNTLSGWYFPGLVENRDYVLHTNGFTLKETVGHKKAVLGAELTDFEFEVVVADIQELKKGQIGAFVNYKRDKTSESYLEVYVKQDGTFALVNHYQNKRDLMSALDLQLSLLPPGPLHLRLRCIGTWIVIYVNGKLVNAWQNNNEVIKGKVGVFAGSEVQVTMTSLVVRPATAPFEQALK